MLVSTEHRADGIILVFLSGRLFQVNADAVRKRLLLLIASGHTSLIVDLAAVPFVDDDGLKALADVWQVAHQSKRCFCLIHANETIKQHLATTGTHPSLVYASLDDALASFLSVEDDPAMLFDDVLHDGVAETVMDQDERSASDNDHTPTC